MPKTIVDTTNPTVRMTGKSPMKWECPVCSSKGVVLRRLCGAWPSEEFKSIPEPDQVAFMQSIATMTTEEIKVKLVDTLVHRRIEEHASLPAQVCRMPQTSNTATSQSKTEWMHC